MLATDGEWSYDIDDLIAHLTSLGGASTAYATDLTNNWKPEITAARQTVQSVKSTIESNAASERASAGSASIEAAAILLTTGAGGTMTVAITTAQLRSDDVEAELGNIDAEVPLHDATITASADSLKDHLTSVLGDDCQANLITVPVLAFDGDGNYQAPSQALMNELERYLAGIADVAHVVNVVSGEADLIEVDIDVHLTQSDAYVFSEVSSEIVIQLTAEMKKRSFGSNLYLNRAYSLANAVIGVQDLDITFTADAEYKDAAGNVICPSGKVLVLGALTVSTFA